MQTDAETWAASSLPTYITPLCTLQMPPQPGKIHQDARIHRLLGLRCFSSLDTVAFLDKFYYSRDDPEAVQPGA